MGALDGKDYGKERMTFSDYVSTPSGLQYFDFRTGAGPTPTPGQLCVIDWTGVTIGYYGRPFEAKNKTKGSSFNDDDKDYFRFRLGADNVIAGVQEAVAGMQVGGHTAGHRTVGAQLPKWGLQELWSDADHLQWEAGAGVRGGEWAGHHD